MKPKDINTPADVARWLRSEVEWNDISSSEMGLRAAQVLEKTAADQLAVTSVRAVDRMAALDLLKKCGITPAGTMTNEEDLLAVGRYVDELLTTVEILTERRRR